MFCSLLRTFAPFSRSPSSSLSSYSRTYIVHSLRSLPLPFTCTPIPSPTLTPLPPPSPLLANHSLPYAPPPSPPAPLTFSQLLKDDEALHAGGWGLTELKTRIGRMSAHYLKGDKTVRLRNDYRTHTQCVRHTMLRPLRLTRLSQRDAPEVRGCFCIDEFARTLLLAHACCCPHTRGPPHAVFRTLHVHDHVLRTYV
jgi:hypothetical protein